MMSAPDDVWDRVSTELVEAGIAAQVEADEVWSRMLRSGLLRWSLEGFDADGFGTLTVMTVDGRVAGSGQVHWSAICEPNA